MKHSTKSSRILIIGAGTWGCSIALALARRGYKNITVFDSHEFPSAIAAGNDINKIMEEETPSDTDPPHDYYMHRISQISGQAWRTDPVYSTFYHPTGFIMAAASEKLYQEAVLPYAERHSTEIKMLHSPSDWQAINPAIFTGPFPSWRGAWRQRGAGWVSARGALQAVQQEASRLGVHFLTGGSHGAVTSLLFSAADEGTDDDDDVAGVKTADGSEHHADLTILCAGAGSAALLDFQEQLRPTAWTLAHLPLSADEAARYREVPVPYNVERGFFIEPSPLSSSLSSSSSSSFPPEIKVCDEHPGYCNFVRDAASGAILGSQPFARTQIPVASERRMRRLLRETMPQLAGRAFSFARICWDADTVDRCFLLDRHPRYASLVLACGGSGHGVNPMPAIGLLVADLVEGKMEERLREMSRWRPEQAVGRDWMDTQGRHGADEKIMEFRDVEEWTKIGEDV